MEFRTIVTPTPLDEKLGYKAKTLFLGSCFATNMGERMEELRFPVMVNPFGILYNPFSIAQSINTLLTGKPFTEEQLFFHSGLWSSFYHHSIFSSSEKDICLQNINKSLAAGFQFLQKANFLVITLGTTWVYQHRKNRMVVANCHKIPANEFDRMPLTEEEIVQVMGHAILKLREELPNLKIILTISPIRHWKDGAVQNMISKATLIMAAQKLCIAFPSCSYFPSFEIMMDDLRDYRFYAEDMLHPSEQAIDYIFEKFRSCAIDEESNAIMNEVEKLVKATKHRPLNPNGEDYQKFLSNHLKQTKTLQQRCPFLNLQEIEQQFESKL